MRILYGAAASHFSLILITAMLMACGNGGSGNGSATPPDAAGPGADPGTPIIGNDTKPPNGDIGGTPTPTGCVANCTNKSCGDDGCGGTCGSCGLNEACKAGNCVCAPNCGAKQCGNDGCGGNCGQCPAGSACSATGMCESTANCPVNGTGVSVGKQIKNITWNLASGQTLELHSFCGNTKAIVFIEVAGW